MRFHRTSRTICNTGISFLLARFIVFARTPCTHLTNVYNLNYAARVLGDKESRRTFLHEMNTQHSCVKFYSRIWVFLNLLSSRPSAIRKCRLRPFNGRQRAHAVLTFSLFICVAIFFASTFETSPTLIKDISKRNCGKNTPVYVFLHLHKTAGNNLKIALLGFAKRNGIRAYHTCHPAVPDSPFAAWWFGRKKSLSGTDCNLAQFAKLPKTQRLSFDLILGHQNVGVHSLVHPRPVLYFTFLRHPLRRKVSHYAQFEGSEKLRLLTALSLSGEFAEKPVKLRSDLLKTIHSEQSRLAEYLVHENRNYMVKRLSTGAYISEIGDDIRFRLIDMHSFAARAALRAARRNLAHRFAFVGLQERYKESLCVLGHILNSACYSKHQKASKRKLFSPEIVAEMHANERRVSQLLFKSLSERLKSMTSQTEHLDLRLYAFAENMFERQLRRYPSCRIASQALS